MSTRTHIPIQKVSIRSFQLVPPLNEAFLSSDMKWTSLAVRSVATATTSTITKTINRNTDDDDVPLIEVWSEEKRAFVVLTFLDGYA